VRIHVKGVERESIRIQQDILTLISHAHDENGKVALVIPPALRWRFQNNQQALTPLAAKPDDWFSFVAIGTDLGKTR
jgi:hypothetical protein